MGSATPPSLGTVSITSPLSSFLFSLVHGQINVFYIKRRSYTPLIHTLDDPIVLTMVSKPRLLGCDLDRGKEKKKEKLTESKTKTQTLTYPMMGKGTTATRGKDLSSPRRRAGRKRPDGAADLLCELTTGPDQGVAPLLFCARAHADSNQRAPVARPFDGAARSRAHAPAKGLMAAPSSPAKRFFHGNGMSSSLVAACWWREKSGGRERKQGSRTCSGRHSSHGG
jgi:hypothetical protein